MFKFTLTIATSVFLLATASDALFAMESSDDLGGTPGKQLVIAMTEKVAPAPINHMSKDAEPAPINHMPADIMNVIFMRASQDTNPRHLTSVCKHWYSVMRENNIPSGAELHYSATNILASAMNPFMQKCMNTYWENLFDNGILRYTWVDNNGMVIEGSAVVTSKFSGLKDTNGTFNLSACGNTGQYFVITESIDQFFKVGEENQDKTVIGIMPCHRILQEIKNSPNHTLSQLRAHLNPDEAPVVLLWRWGNDRNLTWVNYLTTASVGAISSRSLYENWQESTPLQGCIASMAATQNASRTWGATRGGRASCLFLNQNKDY